MLRVEIQDGQCSSSCSSVFRDLDEVLWWILACIYIYMEARTFFVQQNGLLCMMRDKSKQEGTRHFLDKSALITYF